MRVAFISLYKAYPPTFGAAYVTYSCARLTPCEALLVQLSDGENIEHAGNLTIVSVRRDMSSRFRKLAGMPIAMMRISREIARFNPDHVVLEGASWAVYYALLGFVLRKMVPRARIVYHAHNVEYLLRVQRENKIIAGLTGYFERRLLSSSDKSFAVSEEDQQHFSALYGIVPELLPNGIDCTRDRATPEQVEIVRKRYGITDDSILFMGFYAWPPNMRAIQFLVSEIMPWLCQRRPDVRLVITGGDVPFSSPSLINPGAVSRVDLNALLGACRIGVAPIFTGGGTRLKILEYMAAGLPVVTTKKGAEGLGLQEGKHALYAETAQEFGEAILRILSNRPLSEKLSLEGTALVRERFDWISLLHRFASQLGDSRASIQPCASRRSRHPSEDSKRASKVVQDHVDSHETA
jgi:glycosyltransferase involved in cell wall biosynthesis